MGPIVHAVHLFRSHAMHCTFTVLSPLKCMHQHSFAYSSHPNHQVRCTHCIRHTKCGSCQDCYSQISYHLH
uniref:Uncharacterized protein n=1 Tax=Arundo donax TaxID=35708 RepID=A0A0A9CFA7_ARUDO